MNKRHDYERHRQDSEPNPRRIYRDTEKGMLFGVCAGIADYFGFKLCATRCLTVFAALMFAPMIVFAYIAMGVLLPTRPRDLYRDSDDERFWRSVRTAPDAMFSSLRYKFRQLDRRAQKMERYVTSPRFDLDRQFSELEK